MAYPRVYADFQNRDSQDRLRLNSARTRQDLDRLGIELQDGMALTLYFDAPNELGEFDEYTATAVVYYDRAEQCWLATVNWRAIRYSWEPPATDDTPQPFEAVVAFNAPLVTSPRRSEPKELSEAMVALIGMIEAAFKDRKRPAADDITHCSHERRYGGTSNYPCWECGQMTEYFWDRSWRGLSASDLRANGDTAGLFTVEAYCYFLPAYLIAAIRDPDVLDVCVHHLAYHFGPEPSEEYVLSRLSSILEELSDREVEAVLAYFVFAKDGEFYTDCPFCERSIQNLQQELSLRTKAHRQRVD